MEISAVSPALLRTGTDAQPMSGEEAVQEFESILAAEMLKAAREAGKAWGADEEQTGAEGYLELAEQHLARAMAERGVFGLDKLLREDLR